MNNILLIGEFRGEKERDEGAPFAGYNRWLMKGICDQVGIEWDRIEKTTVFNRVPGDDLKSILAPKKLSIPNSGVLMKSKYVSYEYEDQLHELYDRVEAIDPNVIIALGNAGAWAMLGSGKINAIRGASAEAQTIRKLKRKYKVIATYAPFTIKKDWSQRSITLSDFDKAKDESAYPDVRRPQRQVWIEPTLDDLYEFDRLYMQDCKLASIDIETKGPAMTCIGFAPNPEVAIVVPFFRFTTPAEAVKYSCYWGTLEAEMEAMRIVKRWCETIPGLFHNGAYDMHILFRSYGIACLGIQDTMLLHHALQPEMKKALAFLATLYTQEASWKFMSRTDTLKREEQ